MVRSEKKPENLSRIKCRQSLKISKLSENLAYELEAVCLEDLEKTI